MSLQGKYWYVDNAPNHSIRLVWDKVAGRRNGKHVCPANPSHNSSGKRLGDLHLLLPLLPSTAFQDFMWTWFGECLVQEGILHQFALEGFTGFEPRPVHLRWEQPCVRPLPRLWEIQVNGWGGMAPSESGIERIERCVVCGRQVYTGFSKPEYLIDPRRWDGSDFFIVWPMPPFFVTDRVASFFLARGLTGVQLTETRETSFSKHVKTLTPLPLRLWFPEERARRLGEPLDIY
jgi:hypothetical protein